MDNKKLIERIRGLLLDPDTTWQTVKAEPATVPDLLREYVFKLAAVPAVAHFLGWWVIVGFWNSFTRSVLLYVLSILLVWGVSRIIGLLAAPFGAEENEPGCYQLAAFSLTPYFVAGALYLIPPLILLIPVGGLYGCFLLMRGLPAVLDVPAERAASISILVSIAMFLLFILIGRLTGGVVWPHRA
jgi:hypothetical protein